MKRCSKCKHYKDAELFNKNSSRPDGLHSECKDCNKLYHALNKDKIAAKKQADAERIREVQRQYRLANKEAIFVRQQNWRKGNKERLNISNSLRHRRHRQATPPWADIDAIKALYIRAKELQLTVDHIIPLNGKTVSGLHVLENLQLLSKSENCAKKNRYD